MSVLSSDSIATQRIDDIAPAGTTLLRQCQHRRGHWAGRVNDGLEMGIVKVKGMRGDAINECRTGHVHQFWSAQHSGLRRWLQHLYGTDGGVGSFMLCSANRTTQPVVKGAVGFVLDGI